jgi:hypothetical protein
MAPFETRTIMKIRFERGKGSGDSASAGRDLLLFFVAQRRPEVLVLLRLLLSFVVVLVATTPIAATTTTMSLIPPTRMNEQVFKGKKKAAVSGHKLLKKKADALKVNRAVGGPQQFGNQFSHIFHALLFTFTRSILYAHPHPTITAIARYY